MTTLGARGNHLRNLPESIGLLDSLCWLTLENNQISSLPQSFGALNSLIHLNLKNNGLKIFPVQLYQLRNLRFCFLNSNRIEEICPENISETKFMKSLDLNDNPFPDDLLLKNYLKVSKIKFKKKNKKTHKKVS